MTNTKTLRDDDRTIVENIMLKQLKNKLFSFITKEHAGDEIFPCDFEKICALIKPGDVVLIQGRNRLSFAIQYVTKSIWTHAAICIGKLKDIQDETLKEHIEKHYQGSSNEILIVEGIAGKVIKVSRLSHYKKYHLRLCRPINIAEKNLQQALTYAMSAVGHEISLWQIGNLFKLLLFWTILPNWVFAGFYKPKQGFRPKICSSVIAEAFASAKFPILPSISRDREGKHHLTPTDPQFFVPTMIDYSPYFEIIKYPLFDIDKNKVYQTKLGKL